MNQLSLLIINIYMTSNSIRDDVRCVRAQKELIKFFRPTDDEIDEILSWMHIEKEWESTTWYDSKKIGKEILAEMGTTEILSMKGTLTYCRDKCLLTSEEKGNCERWLSHIEFQSWLNTWHREIDLQELLSQVTMDTVLAHFGISNPHSNLNRKCVLPDHQDSTASFKIYPGTKWWYCFGCGKWGGPIQFITHYLGCDRKEATKYFIDNFA